MPSATENGKKKKKGTVKVPEKEETEEEKRLKRERMTTNQNFYRKRMDLLRRASELRKTFPGCEVLVLVTARRSSSIESYHTPKFEGVCTKSWGMDALERSFARKT